MTADPAALHHILHTMGYDYPKTRLIRQFATIAFGRGVSWAKGEHKHRHFLLPRMTETPSQTDETHVRHRQVLAPAFTTSQIRTYLPTFCRVFSQVPLLCYM